MFSVQIKCAVNGREVSLESFATLFIEEKIELAIGKAMAKYVRVDGRNSSDSLAPQNSQAKIPVLSVEQTAKVLGLSSSTIRRLMKVRKIATVRLSRRVMISVEAINDFLEKGMIPARE